MPGFAMFETATWGDEHFTPLSADGRLLFIWSWTNRVATICGLYPASLEQLAQALPGIDADKDELAPEEVDRVDAALVELAAKPLVIYDYDHAVIWVPTRAEKANRSPKVLTAMQREFAAVPFSPLKAMFAERYPAIANERTRYG